jgi:CRP/FNR family transcriptional regulator, polysaccharide utilization system transcription regulator
MALTTKNKSCIECGIKNSLFKHLTADELLLVDKSKASVTYNKGEIIFKQGTPMSHIVSITKGLVKVYIEGIGKKNLILQYVRSDEFIGGPGAFVDNIHHYSVTAIEDTCCCLIDINVFRNLMLKNKYFAYAYIEDISKKGIYNFDRFISLTQKQMHGRIAEAILYFADFVYPNNHESFPFNRKDIAEITALSKDSAGRILNSLHESKTILVNENTIKILNRKHLEQICEKC